MSEKKARGIARIMILKELDPFLGGSQDEIAHRIAQDRMAYHLRRYFGKSEEVDVLNYLRVNSGTVVTQIDHLLLHPFGLLVIERESLPERVQIKDDGQWIRWRGDEAVEIRSPITRAYLRALSLKAFLDKYVKQKGFFDSIELDVLVAVPDTDRIVWPSMGFLPEVCKTDQVHERVNQRILQCRRAATAAGVLTSAERRRLGDFLRSLHRPLIRSAPR
ncbi:MAG: NERD domain-containing protein [Rhodoferax sp.]|nr:NERD domain-containing protein [Rhodoferax sp.]MCB2043239.1 NERD domain-containing protein [Rhodoferax sp.]